MVSRDAILAAATAVWLDHKENNCCTYEEAVRTAFYLAQATDSACDVIVAEMRMPVDSVERNTLWEAKAALENYEPMTAKKLDEFLHKYFVL